MIRISTMMILFAAALLFIGGLIYLMQSVTFQYENITGMSALELSLYGPYINSLTISLSDVVGANQPIDGSLSSGKESRFQGLAAGLFLHGVF